MGVGAGDADGGGADIITDDWPGGVMALAFSSACAAVMVSLSPSTHMNKDLDDDDDDDDDAHMDQLAS